MLLRRRPELVGRHRASAGSIKRPASWRPCTCETVESAARSQRRRQPPEGAPGCTWAWTRCCPTTRAAYRPDDAVLASAALEPVVADVAPRALRGRPDLPSPAAAAPRPHRHPREPLEQNVGGSASTSQRAVLPLLFDIDDQGKVRFERQLLSQSSDSSESRLALADVAEMGRVGVHSRGGAAVAAGIVRLPARLPSADSLRVRDRVRSGSEAQDGTCPRSAGQRRSPGCRAGGVGGAGGRALKSSACAGSWMAVFRTTRRWGWRWSSRRRSSPRGPQAAHGSSSWTRHPPVSRPAHRREKVDRSLRGIGAIGTSRGRPGADGAESGASRAAQAGGGTAPPVAFSLPARDRCGSTSS
jgi:hypothetical protein